MFIPQIKKRVETHGGMVLTEENRATRGETCASATLSTQILHGMSWVRTRASAVRGRRLTARAKVYK
jgi:hypothetical protein